MNCENCLDFQFDDCLRKEDLNDECLLNHSVTEEDIIDDDCYLDENKGGERGHQIFQFLELSSFVAVISCNSYEPVYIIKIIDKGEASDEIKDRYGYSMAPGEPFLRGSYLKSERSRNISRKVFSLVPRDVLCDPDKVFEVFVDIDSNLSASKDLYLALVTQSS